jgi:UDP-glucose:(heptosyl)LPS alpha-1,3-glucosyltransferase
MGGKARLAFCLFEYVPFGGMQMNLLKIARVCMARGHGVDVYAGLWEGGIPEDLNVSVLPVKGIANHRRCESFTRIVGRYLAEKPYDAVVGFNKMPGLDVYYAADSCFAAKAMERGLLYRMSGRCRTYLRLERAVFDSSSRAEILLISEKEKAAFVDRYGTPEHRFHYLPPGIDRDRLAPENPEEVRSALRSEMGIGPDQNVVLMVGSGFETKGVDRAVRALASLPADLRENSLLLVIGDDRAGPFKRLAGRLGVGRRVLFAGGRRDVPRFLAASDLLIHPAYRENTGTVLIEAMAAGLPVLATDVCGYGFHIERAGAGKLVSSPFRQERLNELLGEMLTSDKRGQWKSCGREYIARTDVFSRAEKAVDIIEQVAK